MTKKTTKTKIATTPRKSDQKLTFLEHFKELKRRLTYVAVSIFVFGTGAYFVQHQIVNFLLVPAEGQKLIYTSPGGGLDFLFRVCIYTGIVCSLPIIIYNIVKYLEPVMKHGSVRFAGILSVISAILAVAGMAVGYYLGLPATLHFLFHQFSPTSEIAPLIAIQSYMGFVTLYMFGAALIFQIPLILIFINRIKRLNPRSLVKAERWVILCSFILAVLMNPTPNVVDQLMLAGPMILMYQVGIGIIYLMNRPRYSRKVGSLIKEDSKLRAERQSRLQDASMVWQQAVNLAEHPAAALSAPIKPFQADILSGTLTPDDDLEDRLLKMEIQDDEDTPQPTKIRVHQAALRGNIGNFAGKLKAKKAPKLGNTSSQTPSKAATAPATVSTPLPQQPTIPVAKSTLVMDIASPANTKTAASAHEQSIMQTGSNPAAQPSMRSRKYIDGFRSTTERSRRISTI